MCASILWLATICSVCCPLHISLVCVRLIIQVLVFSLLQKSDVDRTDSLPLFYPPNNIHFSKIQISLSWFENAAIKVFAVQVIFSLFLLYVCVFQCSAVFQLQDFGRKKKKKEVRFYHWHSFLCHYLLSIASFFCEFYQQTLICYVTSVCVHLCLVSSPWFQRSLLQFSWKRRCVLFLTLFKRVSMRPNTKETNSITGFAACQKQKGSRVLLPSSENSWQHWKQLNENSENSLWSNIKFNFFSVFNERGHIKGWTSS